MTCEVCGAPKPPGRVCRSCARHLVDLAFSSGKGEKEFPRLWESTMATAEEPPPRRYDHYEICRTATGEPWELGRGAMGITYKAVDTCLGCTVALKVINTRHLAGAHDRERFLREARTAARLRHPNIASVFHLGPGEDEDCFYAMEFIEGETLEARVQRTGPLPCGLALDIVTQAARALRVAHQQRFIHRDIKPTNVMLVEGEPAAGTGAGETVVKIIDFGLVKAVNETEGTGWASLCTGYFAGTPFYASPEQLAEGTVDERADIYSLGRCLWYSLTGEPPVPFTDAAKEGSDELQGAPLPGHVPAAVRALVESMTAHHPARRPQSAVELLQQIQGCQAALRLEGQPMAFF